MLRTNIILDPNDYNFIAVEGIEFHFGKAASGDICCTVREMFKNDEHFNLGKAMPIEVKRFIKIEVAYRLEEMGCENL